MRSLLLLALLAPAWAATETPPAGPPWHVDLLAAQAHALEHGHPLFVYVTKTS
jgi:hypothetical protein